MFLFWDFRMLKTIMKLHDLAERDMEDLEEECPVCPGGQKLTSSKVIKRHIIGELWNIFSYLDECLSFPFMSLQE